MKLPKLLLGAMLLGIAVETTSCSKKNHEVTPTDQVNNNPTNQPEPTEPCPACGMG
jgi:hypothetical protein